MIISNVFFDESGTHDGSPVMTLSGYFFRGDQSARFSRDWSKILQKYKLPFAHMTDCAHGTGSYKNISKEDRVIIQKKLIEFIKQRASFGISSSISEEEYHNIIGIYSERVSAYSFLLALSVMRIRLWADSKKYDGKIAYFFESGHKNSSEANKFMNRISLLGNDAITANYYSGHYFVNKESAIPLQAADMLAWQHRHYIKRKKEGYDVIRKDFAAMVRPFDRFIDFDSEKLNRFKVKLDRGKMMPNMYANAMMNSIILAKNAWPYRDGDDLASSVFEDL